MKGVLKRLQLADANIISLTGLQGIGKSIAIQELFLKLKNESKKNRISGSVRWLKWPGEKEWYMSVHLDYMNWYQYRVSYSNNISSYLHDKRKLKIQPKVRKPGELNVPKEYHGMFQKPDPEDEMMEELLEQMQSKDYPEVRERYYPLENMISSAEKRVIIWNSLLQWLWLSHSVLIDTRDYGRTDLRAMNSDLSSIHDLWQDINNLRRKPTFFADKRAPNFVIAIQKELTEKSRHFFLGKSYSVELRVFEPRKLVEAYQLQFGSSMPLERVLLERLAPMSGGIFRRFLVMISIVLEEWFADVRRPDMIGVPYIGKGTIMRKFLSLMKDELAIAFPKSDESTERAQRLLQLVVSNDGITERRAAEILECNDMEVSRIATRLESYRFITRENGERREKKLHPATFATQIPDADQ